MIRREPRVLGMVLAGGEGRRLSPLTRDRAKPAVPFGGNYRLVDFALSNLVNGRYLRIAVLTQYKSHSLDRHIAQTWRLSPLLGNYVTPVPAQMRTGRRWFAGSADAIYQNLNLIGDERPDYVCVFGADHIYRMDPRQMVEAHIDAKAGVTVAGIRVPIGEASRYGVIEARGDGAIAAFHEKPEDPPAIPGDEDHAYASMGNYVFTTDALVEAVVEDHERPDSVHDMGGSIMPRMTTGAEAHVYDFADNDVPGSTERDRAYWRDVGTLDSYFAANTDLISVHPVFNLYNMEWPIYSWHPPMPPARFVLDEEGRRGQALSSMVSAGVIVSGGTVRRSVLSPGVRVRSHALVEDAVLLDGVDVGHGAVVRRAILDKYVVVPDGARVGVDPEEDRARGFTVSAEGVTVLGKGDTVPPSP